jgi:hypothetical protein
MRDMATLDRASAKPAAAVLDEPRARLRGRVRTWAAVLVAGLALAACGDSGDGGSASGPAKAKAPVALKGTFVGKVDGSDAYIALVSDAKRVVGYVCDSKQVSGWLDVAAIRDGKAVLSSRSGTALGQATFSADGVSGEVTIGGARHSFSATRSTADAGLYRAARVQRQDGRLGTGETEVGWVVLPDGTQRGGLNTGTTGATLVKAAPRLDISGTNISANLASSTLKMALTSVKGITLIPIP